MNTGRCLFSRPELLGDPSSSTTPAAAESAAAPATDLAKSDFENGAEKKEVGSGGAGGGADGPSGRAPPLAGVGSGGGTRQSSAGNSVVAVPVSMIVRAVRTLTSPPFLQRVGDLPEAGRPRGEGEGEGGGDIPTRLQLAAVSALRALVSGEGPGYVVRATAAAMAAGGGLGAGVGGVVGDLDEREAGETDTGKLCAHSGLSLVGFALILDEYAYILPSSCYFEHGWLG